jgi:predicted transcriptional regulator
MLGKDGARVAVARNSCPIEEEQPRVPAVSIRRSVRQHYVVCLDCGFRGKSLRRHISIRHGDFGQIILSPPLLIPSDDQL